MKKILILLWLTFIRKLRLRRNERLKSVKIDIHRRGKADGDNFIVLTIYSTHDRKAQASVAAPWVRPGHMPALAALEMLVNQALGDFHIVHKLAHEEKKQEERPE